MSKYIHANAGRKPWEPFGDTCKRLNVHVFDLCDIINEFEWELKEKVRETERWRKKAEKLEKLAKRRHKAIQKMRKDSNLPYEIEWKEKNKKCSPSSRSVF